MDGIEALAEAWASIGGKLDDFRAGKTAPNIEDFGGRYAGYMVEAEEMARRLQARGFWLAPMEPTREMTAAGWGTGQRGTMWDIYKAMRDAYLSPETGAKVEGPTSPSSTPGTS